MRGVLALLQAMPMRPPAEREVEAPADVIVALVERYTHLAYPALVGGVIVLLLWGIVRAWRANDLEGLERAQLRADVLRQLRRHPMGASAGRLADELELDSVHVGNVLEELRREGYLDAFRGAEQRTTYVLRPDAARR